MRPPFFILISSRSISRAFAIAAVLAVAGCVTLTALPRALVSQDDGSVQVRNLSCVQVAGWVLPEWPAAVDASLDPGAIRIVTWNIHKQADAGWQRDLRSFIADNDLVLLQESVLDSALQAIVREGALRFVMASSFMHSGTDIGVMTASRVRPVATCTERVVEPLLRLPKSAVINWFALAGRDETLAVVNVHAINFSLSLGTYRAQFREIGDALVLHPGPLIVAGDFNTWTIARAEVVRDLAARLGLTEVPFAVDQRSVFFGHELDHIYIRGLARVSSASIAVRSSDHNPVEATLRVAP